MKLITKELEKRFKEIGTDEDTPLGDKMVIAKFFNPVGAGTWYLTEYDPETGIAFGFVSIFGDWNDEWGSFAILGEEGLQDMKVGMGLYIERDIYFQETKAREIELIRLSL